VSEVYLSPHQEVKKHTIHLNEERRPLGKNLVQRWGARNIRMRSRGNRLEVIRSEYLL
jgi:hypothetical protein